MKDLFRISRIAMSANKIALLINFVLISIVALPTCGWSQSFRSPEERAEESGIQLSRVAVRSASSLDSNRQLLPVYNSDGSVVGYVLKEPSMKPAAAVAPFGQQPRGATSRCVNGDCWTIGLSSLPVESPYDTWSRIPRCHSGRNLSPSLNSNQRTFQVR